MYRGFKFLVRLLFGLIHGTAVRVNQGFLLPYFPLVMRANCMRQRVSYRSIMRVVTMNDGLNNQALLLDRELNDKEPYHATPSIDSSNLAAKSRVYSPAYLQGSHRSALVGY